MTASFSGPLNRLSAFGYHTRLDVGSDGSDFAFPTPTFLHGGAAGVDIKGLGSIVGSLPKTSTRPLPTESPSVAAPQDRIEVSTAARMMEKLSQSSDVRQERLAQIKAAIERGDYDTDEKLEAALSRLFETHGLSLEDE